MKVNKPNCASCSKSTLRSEVVTRVHVTIMICNNE